MKTTVGALLVPGLLVLFPHAHAPLDSSEVTLSSPSSVALASQDAPGHLRTASTSAAPEAPPAPSEVLNEVRTSDELLRRRIEGIVPSHRFPRSDWALLAVSLEHGDTLFARNADLPLAPASNAKVLTSAAALHYLGADFRFPTFVLADGPVVDGTLQGDLILYGTGDPALSDRFHSSRTVALEGLAQQLRALGVVQVQGDIVGDGTFFAVAGAPESWDPRNFTNAYSAPASALSFNENVVTLRVGPGPVEGAAARIRTIPEGVEVNLHNEGRTVSGRAWPPIVVDRDRFEEPIRVTGNTRLGGPEAWRVIPVGDPAAYTASAFRSVLGEEGIRVEGRARAVNPPETSRVGSAPLVAPRLQGGPEPPRVLAIHHSPPLLELLEVVNKHSNNLYSELILLTLGRLVLGEGSFQGGTGSVLRFMERTVGLDVTSIELYDGSGLSRENRVRARDLVAVLAYMEASPQAEEYWSTFPEAGNPQGLRRMYRSAAAGNLLAKTGTIRQVSALSGVVRTAEGEPVLFSIMGNRVPSTAAFKGVEDRIGIELAGFRRSVAPPSPGPSIPGTATEGVAEEGEGVEP